MSTEPLKNTLKDFANLEKIRTMEKMEQVSELIPKIPDSQFIDLMSTKLALMNEYLIALNKYLEEQDGN